MTADRRRGRGRNSRVEGPSGSTSPRIAPSLNLTQFTSRCSIGTGAQFGTRNPGQQTPSGQQFGPSAAHDHLTTPQGPLAEQIRQESGASCTSRSGTAASSLAVMKLCRSECGLIRLSIPAAFVNRRTIRGDACRSSRLVRRPRLTSSCRTRRSLTAAVRSSNEPCLPTRTSGRTTRCGRGVTNRGRSSRRAPVASHVEASCRSPGALDH